MAPPTNRFGVIGKFFGNTVSAAVGYAFGAATAPLLAPPVEELRQITWALYPNRLPDVGVLAAGVAQGQIDPGTAAEWATKHGFGGGVFQALVDIANEGLPLGSAMAARRRNALSPGELHTVYRRHSIEEAWWPALDRLVLEILDPAQLAAAIHRGLIPDPGLLKGEQPSGPFNVEAYPVYPIDAVEEAAGSGYDRNRLGVLVGLQGLPMGTHEAAQALFRGIITHGDYIRAFNESNSRNEWAQAVLDQSRQIPTARDFLENALRGYRTLGEALAGADLHGMSVEHATMIYQNQGRPMNVRQITQALSRGGTFQPEPGEITDPYRASIVEGSLKPAYYDLAEALKHTLPSPFAMRQLATSGVWDEAKTAQRLKDLGWNPQDADEVAAAWTGGTATTGAGKWADRAKSSLFTTTKREYLDESIDQAGANLALDVIGVPAPERPAIFAAWDKENEIGRKELTTAQIKKAYAEGGLTKDDAIGRLVDSGVTPGDAELILNPAGI